MQITFNVGVGAAVVAALIGAAGWYAFKGSERPPGKPSLQAGGGGSWKAPEFIPTNGGMLTIAWVKGYESFEKRSPSETDLKLPRGVTVTVPLPFGETVSEIRTAAKYQYQIRLEKRWPVKCSEAQCVVRAGTVELAEPVAIYHEESHRKTRSGWARFDKADNLEQLNQSLGPMLAARGNEPRNRDIALRDGRKEVERFVREWMVKDGGGTREIVVLYPGEQLVDGKPVVAH